MNDPTIDRIRQIRHQVSAKFGHDAKKLIAHYKELQKKHPGRMVKEHTSK